MGGTRAAWCSALRLREAKQCGRFPRARRVNRLRGKFGPVGCFFWRFPPFFALVEAVAVAVHLQDMDLVYKPVRQGPCQALIILFPKQLP